MCCSLPLMQLRRLSGRKICERVKNKGFLWKGKHLFARSIIGLPRGYEILPTSGIYIGTVISAKQEPSAVKRNRMRRRCREALRIRLREIAEREAGNTTEGISAQISAQILHVKLMLLPRSSSLSASFGELIADIDVLLSHLTTRASQPSKK